MLKTILLSLIIACCGVLPGAYSQSDKLTQDRILSISVAKAKGLGFDTGTMDITYDNNNEKLKTHLKRIGVSVYDERTKTWVKDPPTSPEEEYPELKGKDYQAVYFGPKDTVLGGDLWIFVDKNTGEVLRTVAGQ